MAQYQQNGEIPQQPNMAYSAPQMKYEHQPNGVVHEHQHQKSVLSKWTFGLFDCCSPMSTCCLATWCPCYLFGKTYERNKTGEKDPSGFNGMCCAWFGLACLGFQPCLQCITRGNIRDKYNIDGDVCGDFMTSWCCACCTLVQEDKESIVRQTGLNPKTGVVYQPVSQMAYP